MLLASCLQAASKHTNPIDPPDLVSPDHDRSQQLPWLLYLQGGPGHECPNPGDFSLTHAFVDKGYKMLYMDQRGTGMSSAISNTSLAQLDSVHAQITYLAHFRADNIVRDAEALRKCLTVSYPPHKQSWSVLGHSFGGFCATTYLSLYPSGLREVFITGGLPPVSAPGPDAVYSKLASKVADRNAAYYSKHPGDVTRVKALISHLANGPLALPAGGTLTPHRLLTIGLALGSHAGVTHVHDLVLRATTDLARLGTLARPTLDALESATSFDNNPLYALLHEPIYCQDGASGWSASGVLRGLPAFDMQARLQSDEPVLLTGEMVFPETIAESAVLGPLSEVAEGLAKVIWGRLYDVDVLRRNEVPVYAAVYIEDMYVDYEFSKETAGIIKG